MSNGTAAALLSIGIRSSSQIGLIFFLKHGSLMEKMLLHIGFRRHRPKNIRYHDSTDGRYLQICNETIEIHPWVEPLTGTQAQYYGVERSGQSRGYEIGGQHPAHVVLHPNGSKHMSLYQISERSRLRIYPRQLNQGFSKQKRLWVLASALPQTTGNSLRRSSIL
jgi:hypothetical protein